MTEPTRPLLEAAKTATKYESFPLAPVFLPSGLFCRNPDSCKCTMEEKRQFKQSFRVYPSNFIRIEVRLEQRCNDHGVAYISPELQDSVGATIERKAQLKKAIDKMRKRAERADESNEKKALRRTKDKHAKRKAHAEESPEKKARQNEASKNRMQAMRKQESPEERAIRNEANMKYMQNVRMNESLEDKAARNKKRMEAWRNKIMNETKEEMADRKRKNMLYQRQYRQHNTGLNFKKRSAKRALVSERATKAQRVKVHYINGLLLEKVGISIHDMRVTACIYGNPKSLLPKKRSIIGSTVSPT